jgi:hypothetical protein
LLARAILTDDSSIEAVIEPELIERRIDLIEPIESATRVGFALSPSGVTTGFVDLTLDAERVLRIVPGTLGQIDCDVLDASKPVRRARRHARRRRGLVRDPAAGAPRHRGTAADHRPRSTVAPPSRAAGASPMRR